MNPQRERTVCVTVNGQVYTRQVSARGTLADFLRQDLRLTGTHVGCEHGVCGACTVLLNGEPVRSCLLLAVQTHRAAVETVEGLAPREGPLHPLQEAFRQHHALDYHLPTAMEAPAVQVDHVETLSPLNLLGSKGAGESGTIPAQAAMVSAIEDALAPLGVHLHEFPLGPLRLWELIEQQRAAEP